MKKFFLEVVADVKRTSWQRCGFISGFALIVYGMLLFNPVTAYDFNAAKGDFLQVFLTYFFMHRAVQGLVAGLFHDFSPFWTISVGFVLMILSAHLLAILFDRMGFKHWQSLMGVALWLAAPFFYNRSIYQHAFPSEALGFCFDVTAALSFHQLRHQTRVNWCLVVGVIGFAVLSTSIYQAHLALLLTMFLGVCMFERPQNWKQMLHDWVMIAGLLFIATAFWFLFNHGPMLCAKLVGIDIPKSGGAHDTIYWFTGDHPFVVNLKALFVGLLLNWGYNALFVVGLRWVLVGLLFCLGVSLYQMVKRNGVAAMATLAFALSIFVFPVVQCFSANLRVFYCFIAFIAFGGMLLLRVTEGFRLKTFVAIMVVLGCIMGMAHETSTLYYYNWKVKEHDKLHMGIVARDLWSRYGLKIEKPVAVIGGWRHYPTCWEDLRPFRQLPLVSHPFTTYSNMSHVNVPREFYMVAREKIGLLMNLPDIVQYQKLFKNQDLIKRIPSYPHDGYIIEDDDVIIVNLGRYNSQWGTFRYQDFASPNERLLERTLRLSRVDEALFSATEFFRRLAKDYPWTLVLEPQWVKE